MIDWHRVKDSLPETDNMDCLLYNEDAGHVLGPLLWKKMEDSGMWMDLFGPYASREAGVSFIPGKEGGPTHWAPWNGPEEDKK